MWRHRSLALILAALVLFAPQAWGQQPVHRVAVLLNTENPEANQAWLEGLRERGYVVGGNLQIEYRYSRAQPEHIPALVAELVALGPEVIVASGPQNALGAPCCTDQSGWGLGPGSVEGGPAFRERDLSVAGLG